MNRNFHRYARSDARLRETLLRLQNHSGADLTNATILLTNRVMIPDKATTPIATGVTAAHRGIVKSSFTMTVRTQGVRTLAARGISVACHSRAR